MSDGEGGFSKGTGVAHSTRLSTAEESALNVFTQNKLSFLSEKKLTKLKRCVSRVSFRSNKFGLSKLLPGTNFLAELDDSKKKNKIEEKIPTTAFLTPIFLKM